MKKNIKYLFAVLFASIAGFFYLRGCDQAVDNAVDSPVLRPGIIEKLIINPYTRKLTIITPEKEETLFLPDRPSSIEIDEEGNTEVTSKQFGTELRPYIGVTMSDKFRLTAGLDLLYWKRWDLGLGVAGQVGNHAPVVFLNPSYNVWGNVQLGLVFDNKQNVGLSLTVRL